MDRSSERDVIIVGAGLSGLCAARRCCAAGASVTVLEARKRVGGRTLSVDLQGAPVDLGGQWLGPGQERALALVDELGVRLFRQHIEGRKLLEIDGELRTYRGLLPRIPILALADLGGSIQRLERMARGVPRGDPMSAERAAEYDAISVAEWVARNVRTAAARTMLKIAIHAIFAVEPRSISLLYFLHYTRAGGSFTRLAEVREGAQTFRMFGGAQQLSERLAANLGPEELLLGAPVSAIEAGHEGVVLHSKGRAPLRSRFVILAMPPVLIREIAVTPGFPGERQRLDETMSMGSMIKCVVAYKRPFWRRAGLSGEVVSNGAPLRMVFDACAPDGSAPALVGFAVGDQVAGLSALSPRERRQALIEHFVRLFGAEAAEPLAYVEHDWSADRWSRGGHAGIMPPRLLSQIGGALRAPVGRIHFAGTETATRWVGYLDGAIESGDRAADEVLERLRSEA